MLFVCAGFLSCLQAWKGGEVGWQEILVAMQNQQAAKDLGALAQLDRAVERVKKYIGSGR